MDNVIKESLAKAYAKMSKVELINIIFEQQQHIETLNNGSQVQKTIEAVERVAPAKKQRVKKAIETKPEQKPIEQKKTKYGGVIQFVSQNSMVMDSDGSKEFKIADASSKHDKPGSKRVKRTSSLVTIRCTGGCNKEYTVPAATITSTERYKCNNCAKGSK